MVSAENTSSATTPDQAYDCTIIGGGPAGSTVAALVAQAGFRTLLLERESMPREHVGESLMPEAYWTFQRLGVVEKLQASRFRKKNGVQFVSNTGKESAPFFFRTHDDRESSDSWHVERGEFDQMLFENAAFHGAECRQDARVTDVLFDGERAVGIRLQQGGATHEIASKVVVDASGQSAMLAGKLGVRRINPDLRKAGVWAHYTGAPDHCQDGGVRTIIMQTQNKESWFWYIPQSSGVVSVGVVGDRDYLLTGRGTPQQVFDEELTKCPTLQGWLADAKQVDEMRAAKEFSYTTERSAGDGWVLVGDAWGFIDPVYSSGVYFAVKSGELAADCVVDALQAGEPTGERLGAWVQPFSERTSLVRKLVHAFYSGEFRVGQFLKEYPQHNDELVDLLIGRIFDGERGAIFADLEPWLAERRAEAAL
ncbi:MAG: NAD(P)/FAD-dependent oxidoreductase [Planctomycetota bacterium]